MGTAHIAPVGLVVAVAAATEMHFLRTFSVLFCELAIQESGKCYRMKLLS